MNLDDLVTKCTEWSRDRKILENGNTKAQFMKLTEEMGELAASLVRGKPVKDDIGDMLVVLNNLALLSGTTLKECLRIAYLDIKDRRGYMNPAGVFIKEADY
jgi:NTP pyrophosphatase (non-canonical NTP hydrolase)